VTVVCWEFFVVGDDDDDDDGKESGSKNGIYDQVQ
jgi:hypothetical protein